MLPFDLHVLSMPPAFNLSQDQTLQFNLVLLLQYKSKGGTLKLQSQMNYFAIHLPK